MDGTQTPTKMPFRRSSSASPEKYSHTLSTKLTPAASSVVSLKIVVDFTTTGYLISMNAWRPLVGCPMFRPPKSD